MPGFVIWDWKLMTDLVREEINQEDLNKIAESIKAGYFCGKLMKFHDELIDKGNLKNEQELQTKS